MKLLGLNPRWCNAGGENIFTTDEQGNRIPAPHRSGVAVIFNCPCGKCNMECCIEFKNPLDGGDCHNPKGTTWNRVGDTFETLTLTPSILRTPAKGGCGWHGYITNGEIVTC